MSHTSKPDGQTEMPWEDSDWAFKAVTEHKQPIGPHGKSQSLSSGTLSTGEWNGHHCAVWWVLWAQRGLSLGVDNREGHAEDTENSASWTDLSLSNWKRTVWSLRVCVRVCLAMTSCAAHVTHSPGVLRPWVKCCECRSNWYGVCLVTQGMLYWSHLKKNKFLDGQNWTVPRTCLASPYAKFSLPWWCIEIEV